MLLSEYWIIYRHQLIKTQPPLPATSHWIRRQTYLYWRLNDLLLLDLLAEDGVKEERRGTVVDQPGRLLQGLQICPLLRDPWLLSLKDKLVTLQRVKFERSGMIVVHKNITTSYSRIKSTGLHIVAHRSSLSSVHGQLVHQRFGKWTLNFL